ncbi:MAG: GNAT family N-acetyltransferase [Oscillospiraceae bacterium]|jgi:ribosomal-protein-alanine N-acetyltransferase
MKNTYNMEGAKETVMETERLILRHWREEDAPELFKLASDPDTGPWCGWKPHSTEKESLGAIKIALSGRECYAICLKETGTPAGSIELFFEDRDFKLPEYACELGFWMGKPYRRMGYTQEAAERLLARAFTELGIKEVYCSRYEDNDASEAVQEKLGFQPYRAVRRIEQPPEYGTPFRLVNVLTRERWESLRKNQ